MNARERLIFAAYGAGDPYTFKPKGQIKTTLTIWCGEKDCAESQRLAATHKVVAGQEAKIHGWIYTNAYGWVCPKCVLCRVQGQ